MAKLDAILYGNRWKPFIGLIAIILALPFFSSMLRIFFYGADSNRPVQHHYGRTKSADRLYGANLFRACRILWNRSYVSGMLTTKAAMSPWLAMILGMVVTFGIAYLIGIPILKLKGHFLALATLGFNIIIYILIVGLSDYTGPLGLHSIPTLSLFGLDLSNPLYFYYFIWTVVGLVIIFSTNIVRSPIGRLLRSIHDSEIATQTLGVNVAKYKVAIFAISAAYASLAGSFYAHFINFIAPPTFYINFSILLLIMVMVGGSHSIWGAMLGTGTIMFLQELIRYIGKDYLHLSGPVEIVVYGFMIVIVMMFAPRGVISILSGAWVKASRSKTKMMKEAKGV